MTRSSRTRRAKARAKKHVSKAITGATSSNNGENEAELPPFSEIDKRYLLGFFVLSLSITAGYWWMGGRNLFVFPALMCILVGFTARSNKLFRNYT